MIKIICAKCGKKLEAPDEAAVKKVRCPECKTVFNVSKKGKPFDGKKSKRAAALSSTAKPSYSGMGLSVFCLLRSGRAWHLLYWAIAAFLLSGMRLYLEYEWFWGAVAALLLSGAFVLLVRQFAPLLFCISELRKAIAAGRSGTEILKISDSAFGEQPPGDTGRIGGALALAFLPVVALITSGFRLVFPGGMIEEGRAFLALIFTILLIAGFHKILPDEKYNKRVFTLFKKILKEEGGPAHEFVSGQWAERRERVKISAAAESKERCRRAEEENRFRKAPDTPPQPGCCWGCLKSAAKGWVVSLPMIKLAAVTDHMETIMDESWKEHYQYSAIEIFLCGACRDFLKSHPIRDLGLKAKIASRLKKSDGGREMIEKDWKFGKDTNMIRDDPGFLVWDLNTRC